MEEKPSSKYTIQFTPRNPKVDPPPCDGTQAMWGYNDGEVMSGDAHYMFSHTTGEGDFPILEPDIAWWFSGEDLAVAVEQFLHPKPEEKT